MGRPLKRSLTLLGHATSVSMETEFWRAFRRIAEDRGMALNALAAEIDAQRGPDTGLASAIRVFVLAELERRLDQRPDQRSDQRSGGIE
ncbi:ribbon-helix-helix domain-containing protein [Rhodobaculum claviforme]|uniref:Aryl-sulfate sulfotransferase n=1 Tax=Rhodobaculum claviforme TaxID=1549854 RepID=A0A934TL01_9RHOB|nr:ribbon-helix-helix domain-containing protein [Rhodobaculum claviforme]MBK5928085.1 aryl-sulfate sulfotransferase [Rhodobaculum claviforme]